MQTPLARLIARIADNLPEMSDEMIHWWIDHTLELQGILAGLTKEPDTQLDIWKTLKLGTGPNNTPDNLRKALQDNKIHTTAQIENIISKPDFVMVTKEMKIDLVKLPLVRLGFNNGAKRSQIYERAEELGLKKCLLETGFQLRSQYNDQPKDERIHISTEPILVSDGHLGLVSLQHDNSGLWISVEEGSPDYFWSADSEWIFVHPPGMKNNPWTNESPNSVATP
jgi:hypothetical protein